MKNNVFNQEIKALSMETSYRKKSFAAFTAATILTIASVAVNMGTVRTDETSAAECPSGTCNNTFNVNVADSLSVSITSPVSGATGDVGEFLRNTVNVDVASNVSNGFTASMYSRDNTNLTHTMLSEYNIPTLTSSVQRGNFTVDQWGYSLKSASLNGNTYGETDAGNNNSYYYPLTASTSTPITVLSAASGTKTGSQSIYFGTKASASKPAGTYSNTVVISVVTSAINSTDNPITPVNPATPSIDPTPNDNVAQYTGAGTTTGVGVSASNGTTVYTRSYTTPASGDEEATTTTTTEVSGGDNTRAYPQGVITTNEANVTTSGSELPVGLAVTAASAATAGIVFFVIAKKRDDDDEEEQQ